MTHKSKFVFVTVSRHFLDIDLDLISPIKEAVLFNKDRIVLRELGL
jgi:hypothetical protein